MSNTTTTKIKNDDGFSTTPYRRVLKDHGWTKAELKAHIIEKNWYHLTGQTEVGFFYVGRPMLDENSCKEKAREERERIKWSQSYSRNPRQMDHKVWVARCDAQGNVLLSATQKKEAILWAHERAKENPGFASTQRDFLVAFVVPPKKEKKEREPGF